MAAWPISQVGVVQRFCEPFGNFLSRLPSGCHELRLSLFESLIPSFVVPEVFEIIPKMFDYLIPGIFGERFYHLHDRSDRS